MLTFLTLEQGGSGGGIFVNLFNFDGFDLFDGLDWEVFNFVNLRDFEG